VPAGDIPSHIDVDVSHLEMHGVLRVSDLPHSDKIKYLNAEDATVAHVVSIREEAPTAAEVEAAAAATAAAAAAAAAEPEVAKKGKPEDAAKKPDAGAKKPDSEARGEEVSLGRSK
jgi:large subunit ribosomal protein L25